MPYLTTIQKHFLHHKNVNALRYAMPTQISYRNYCTMYMLKKPYPFNTNAMHNQSKFNSHLNPYHTSSIQQHINTKAHQEAFTKTTTIQQNAFHINQYTYNEQDHQEENQQNEQVEAEHVADTSDIIVEMTKDNYEKLITSGEPLIIDFYADWCQPCQQLSPLLEKYTKAHQGIFKLAKVNTDNEPELAQSFQIASLPTVFFVYNQQILDQFKGFMPEENVQTALQNFANLIQQQQQQQQQQGQSNDTQTQQQQVDADSPEYLIQTAGTLLQEGQFDEAIQYYQQVYEKAENNPFMQAKALGGLLTISLYQNRMEAAKSLVSQLKRDYMEALENENETNQAIALYDIYEEAGNNVVEAVMQQDPSILQTEKEQVVYQFLVGEHEEAMEKGLNMIKKGEKNEGRKILVLFMNMLQYQQSKKQLVSDVRKRMASLLY